MKKLVLAVLLAAALSAGLSAGSAFAAGASSASTGSAGRANHAAATNHAAAGRAAAPASTRSSAAPAQKRTQKVVWKKSRGFYYCYVNGVKQKGMRTVLGKTYSFTSKGAQRVGWLKTGDDHRYFRIRNGAQGYMIKNRVKNGIDIDSDGSAKVNEAAQSELDLLVRANSITRSVTKPALSKSKKLRKVWNWMRDECTETSSHRFRPVKGWQRSYAREILYGRHGSCEAMGAGFAYLAQACGAKRCAAVATGGHGWAEVDGKIFDPEWSRHIRGEVFGLARSQMRAGLPGYFTNQKYVIAIQPRSKVWSKAKPVVSRKQGLVKSKGSYCYYRNGKKVRSKWVSVGSRTYYFKSNGKAATGSAKVGGKHYVFASTGVLAKGEKVRAVKVGGCVFQVTAKGRAKAGWNAAKTKRFAKNGQLMTGIWIDGGKLWALSSKGVFNKSKTAALRGSAKKFKNAEKVVQLMGKPAKVKRGLGICMIVPGHEDEDGTITQYTYDHVIVEVFLSKADGREYLLSVYGR